MQVAATYAQLSRGKFELQALSALGRRCSTCAAWPGTCRLFASAEFGFVALPPSTPPARR
jgi:argininosuccinate lyase